jgi:hypothetical protein
MYCQHIDINLDNVLPLLEASSFYMMSGLQSQCEEYLCRDALKVEDTAAGDDVRKKKRVEPEGQREEEGETSHQPSSSQQQQQQIIGNKWVIQQLPRIWTLAEQTGSTKLSTACAAFVCLWFQDMTTTTDSLPQCPFNDLPIELVLHVLSTKGEDIVVSSERKVLEAVIGWCWSSMKSTSTAQKSSNDNNNYNNDDGDHRKRKTVTRSTAVSPSFPTDAWWTVSPEQQYTGKSFVDGIAIVGEPLWPYIRWNMLPAGHHPDKLPPLARQIAARYVPSYKSCNKPSSYEPRVTNKTRELLLDGQLWVGKGNDNTQQQQQQGAGRDRGRGRGARVVQPPASPSPFEAVAWLGKAGPSLRKLDLSGCTALTPIGASTIGTLCPHLEWLCLSGCNQVGDYEVMKITKWVPRLEVLLLDDLPKLNVDCIQGFEGSCLKELSLKGCTGITDDAFREMSFKSTWSWHDSLERINISGCERITGLGIKHLAILCHRLAVITVSEVLDFREELPKRHELGISHPPIQYIFE